MGANNSPRLVVGGKLRCSSKRHIGNRMVDLTEFCRSKTPDGLSYSCKPCRSKENAELCNLRYKRWKSKDPIKAMLQGLKGNARRANLPFELTAEDIIIPDACPVLGIPLFFSVVRTYNTPSVDRINNTNGYVVGNIVVCSWRANMLKKDATVDELIRIANFYKDKINE